MRKLFFLAGALVAMSSCAINEVYDLNSGNPDVISFGTYVGQTTKGTVLDQAALQAEKCGIGIMAYQTYQDEWTEGATFIPNFMYNQKVTYSDGSWSYSPLKYWPNAEGDKLSFFTYAPYPSETNGIAPVSTNTSEGLPQIGFTLNSDPSKMVDFVAGQNMDMERQQDRVLFYLKHQLTRVTFSAIALPDNSSDEFGGSATGDNQSFVVVKTVDVVGGTDSKFYTYGVYTHNMFTTNNEKNDHSQDGTWVVSEPIDGNYSLADIVADGEITRGAYTGNGIPVAIGNTNYTPLFLNGDYLFLLPPNGSEGLSEDGISLKIAYDIITMDDAVDGKYTKSEAVYTVTLPEGTLKQGKAYNFQLKFNASEIIVDANVVDWDESEIENDDTDVHPFDEEGEEVEPEGFDYASYTVGNYVNSEGSIVEDKSQAIGMVAQVGDNYAMLASLVRVLDLNWMTPVSDVDYASSASNGYDNTQALKDFSAVAKSCWSRGQVEAFKSADDETKGQWYMPASNELRVLLTENFLVKLYGEEWANDLGGFWSSTEMNATYVMGGTSDLKSYMPVNKEQTSLWCTIPIIRF